MGTGVMDGLQIRCDCEESRLERVYAKYARVRYTVCHLENTQQEEINE